MAGRFPRPQLPCGIAADEPGPPGGGLDAAVAAARAGDAHALDVVLRAHYDRIHAVCRRITTHEQDALDATQEALLAISRGIVRFDGRSAFSTWVYRVATNAALDEVRRRGRRPAPVGEELEAAGGVAGDPASVAADRVDVDRALRRLPPDQRAAVVLRDLAGLDYDEIGATLAIPPGTVRSRIARGRIALAAALRGGEDAMARPARNRTGDGERRSGGEDERSG